MLLELVFSASHDCERIQELILSGKKALLLQYTIEYCKYYKDTTKNKKIKLRAKA